MFRLLLLTVFLVGVIGDAVVVNDAIDKLLVEGRKILIARGQDKIKVPAINKSFEKTIFKKIKIQGEFHTSEGLFQDTTSLHRTGDVTMNTQGNKLTLGASMGLSKLDIDFSHYSFKLMAIHSEGSIHAECKQNAVTAVITIVHDGPKCTVNLDKASIDSLGGFQVQMSGPGDINQLGTMLFTWILNQFNELLRGVINNHIESALKESLTKVDLCKMIPH